MDEQETLLILGTHDEDKKNPQKNKHNKGN